MPDSHFRPQESVPILACNWLRLLISFSLTNTIERSRITETGVGSFRMVNTIGRTTESYDPSPAPRLPPHIHTPLPMPEGSTWKFDCKLKLSRSALLKKNPEKKGFIDIRRKKGKNFLLVYSAFIIFLRQFTEFSNSLIPYHFTTSSRKQTKNKIKKD